MMDKRKTLYDKCFKDRDGIVVVGQQANLPIIVATITALPALLVPGIAGHLFAFVAFGSFFTWAWMELFDGVNYFRRALGAVAMIVLFIAAFVYTMIKT